MRARSAGARPGARGVPLGPRSAGASAHARDGTLKALADQLRDALGLADGRSVSARRLEELLHQAAAVERRIADYLDCEAAGAHELQWLDPAGLLRALSASRASTSASSRRRWWSTRPRSDGGFAYRPLEADLLRLVDARSTSGRGRCSIESEQGESHQAFLCLGRAARGGAVPVRAGGAAVRAARGAAFPVDAALHARYVANRDAVRLVRRRIVDADHAYAEESAGRPRRYGRRRLPAAGCARARGVPDRRRAPAAAARADLAVRVGARARRSSRSASSGAARVRAGRAPPPARRPARAVLLPLPGAGRRASRTTTTT